MIEAASSGAAGAPTGGLRERFPKVEFLGLDFTNLDLPAVLAWLAGRDRAWPFAYLVTPNVDHVLNVERDPELRELYAGADLCLCDSRVLAKLARASGLRLHVVPGSELVDRFLNSIGPGREICIVGSNLDLAPKLRARLPHVKISAHVPPMGLRRDEAAQLAVVDFVRNQRADYIFLAVGSPQQEMLAARLRDAGDLGGTALCIGASISFFTGEAKRAPRWMQRMTLEWAYRLLSEPRRLAHRYLVKGPAIFPAYARWAMRRRRNARRGKS